MRLVILALAAACPWTPLLAEDLTLGDSDAKGVSVAQWGNYLMVTAPTTGEHDAIWAQRLSQSLSGDFKDSALSEVADFLRHASDCAIVIDPELRVDDPHLTFTFDHMTLGNVLHWVTQLTGTSFATVDGAIFLSKKPYVGASKTTLYDVSDLTMTIKDFPAKELAYNQGSGGSRGIKLMGTQDDDPSKTESVDDLANFVRQTIAKQ